MSSELLGKLSRILRGSFMIFRAEDEEYLTYERLRFTRGRGSRNDIEQAVVKFREQKKSNLIGGQIP